MKDYYKILEIQPDASLEVMNNAYRALVRKYHPDLYHTRMKAPMTLKMQAINEAYNTLSIPASRAEYDRRYGAGAVEPAKPSAVRGLHWRTLLLWALGTFVVLKYLLKPFLFSPWGRLIILGAILYLTYRLMARSKRRP